MHEEHNIIENYADLNFTDSHSSNHEGGNRYK